MSPKLSSDEGIGTEMKLLLARAGNFVIPKHKDFLCFFPTPFEVEIIYSKLPKKNVFSDFHSGREASYHNPLMATCFQEFNKSVKNNHTVKDWVEWSL